MSNLLLQVRAIQTSMVEAGQPYLTVQELEDMRCLIRLTVEFASFILHGDTASAGTDNLQYVCESVFSGIDSFALLSAGYRILPGAQPSMLQETGRTPINEVFLSLYAQFLQDAAFEKRCRLLLDLFKLQIVFAGISF